MPTVYKDRVQWFQMGDHPHVRPLINVGDQVCEWCGMPLAIHGIIPQVANATTGDLVPNYPIILVHPGDLIRVLAESDGMIAYGRFGPHINAVPGIRIAA